MSLFKKKNIWVYEKEYYIIKINIKYQKNSNIINGYGINVLNNNISLDLITDMLSIFNNDIMKHLHYLQNIDILNGSEQYIRTFQNYYKLCRLKIMYCIANSIKQIFIKDDKIKASIFVDKIYSAIFDNFNTHLTISDNNINISSNILDKTIKLANINEKNFQKNIKIKKNNKIMNVEDEKYKTIQIYDIIVIIILIIVIFIVIFLNLNIFVDIKKHVLLMLLLFVLISYIIITYLINLYYTERFIESFATNAITNVSNSNTLTKYPREPLKSINHKYADGTIVRTNASTYYDERSDIYLPSNVFNPIGSWASSDVAYTGLYPTIFKVHYFNNDTTYYGEWVMIDLGEKIILNNYKLFSSFKTDAAPRNFRIYATNDDASWNNTKSMKWNKIDERTDILFANDQTPNTFTINQQTAYRYYAIIVHNTGTDGWAVEIKEWELYGKPYIVYNLQDTINEYNKSKAELDAILKNIAIEKGLKQDALNKEIIAINNLKIVNANLAKALIDKQNAINAAKISELALKKDLNNITLQTQNMTAKFLVDSATLNAEKTLVEQQLKQKLADQAIALAAKKRSEELLLAEKLLTQTALEKQTKAKLELAQKQALADDALKYKNDIIDKARIAAEKAKQDYTNATLAIENEKIQYNLKMAIEQQNKLDNEAMIAFRIFEIASYQEIKKNTEVLLKQANDNLLASNTKLDNSIQELIGIQNEIKNTMEAKKKIELELLVTENIAKNELLNATNNYNKVKLENEAALLVIKNINLEKAKELQEMIKQREETEIKLMNEYNARIKAENDLAASQLENIRLQKETQKYIESSSKYNVNNDINNIDNVLKDNIELNTSTISHNLIKPLLKNELNNFEEKKQNMKILEYQTRDDIEIIKKSRLSNIYLVQFILNVIIIIIIGLLVYIFIPQIFNIIATILLIIIIFLIYIYNYKKEQVVHTNAANLYWSKPMKLNQIKI